MTTKKYTLEEAAEKIDRAANTNKNPVQATINAARKFKDKTFSLAAYLNYEFGHRYHGMDEDAWLEEAKWIQDILK